ncbi:WEB family protein At1g12150-like [Humulus lupulus]|uniref:WEB family protein At1g12150-like n=1 Tax=Humulus lupulus TaxID=3486 RepID=UPI002B408D2D|nr:WEB family protein At1g12150-like [Humulus lupulus]
MSNLRIKVNEKSTGSPRTEVGEIDTRAPFQSVKAAVNLFGVVASLKGKPVIKRRPSSENVLHKETELLLAQRELNKIKQNLESAETTKSRALSELERAQRTLHELTTKLNAVKDSKQSEIAAAEVVKERAKKLEIEKSKKVIGTEAWKRELDQIRKEYASTVIELDAAKQELNMIRQDFDVALEAKQAAFQQAGEAQRSAKANSEKAIEISRQIAEMRASTEQIRLAFIQIQQEQSKLIQEREASLQSYITAKEVAEKKLESLKKEADVVQNQQTRDLEAKLEETNAEIEFLQEEMRKAHAVEMDNVRVVTMELNEATSTLQKVSEEESSLKSLVSSMRLELENVKKEMEIESLVANHNAEILNIKQKEPEISDELSFKLKNLIEETNSARQEEEEMKNKTIRMKQEAEAFQGVTEDAETKLELTLVEAEKVKAAEQKALGEVKVVNAENNVKIKLSVEKFQSLTQKVQESQNMADAKEAENEALLGEIKLRKMENERKADANLKAIEEIKIATDMALRKAEMADSAKSVVEGELYKWRQQQEQRKDS